VPPLSPVKCLRASHLLVASLLVTAGVATSAAEPGCQGVDAQALQLMDKMSRSLRQVSYHGIVTLQRGDDMDMEVMQVSHSVGDGMTSERLTELTGQGAQVERAAHALDCVHPGHRMLRLESLSDSERCGIAEQYRFSIAEGGRIAGRKAVRIRIEPRDMYRYGYVLAVDSETGLLLKSQINSHSHGTLETMQFAQLTYTDAVPPAIEVAVIHQAEHPEPDGTGRSAAVPRAWTVGWLPRGFVATDSPGGNVGRRSYTDGLAVFSIFLEDLDRELLPGEGIVRHGGTTTYTRGMRLAGSPVLVTVIGDVPVNTARMVADSVNWER
jgi:sigma-E factor negative regulatory protein RseB